MPRDAAEITGQPHMTADRRQRMTRLSRLVDGMVAPSVRERGFVIGRLVSHWRQIAGDMADWSRPTQLNLSRRGGGTLKIAIASGYGPIALQMKQPIIDRVNATFGYRAVAELVFIQTLAHSEHSPKCRKRRRRRRRRRCRTRSGNSTPGWSGSTRQKSALRFVASAGPRAVNDDGEWRHRISAFHV